MSVKHAAKEPAQPSANVPGELLRDGQSNADKEKRRSQVKKKPEDFQFAKIIGEGSYSTVFLAKEIITGNEYAIKVLEKRHILKEKKSQYVMREKEVFSRLNHPFFVRLYFTFQDQERLYFGLSYAKRGELLYYINKLGCFDERCTRFYTSEIIMALEHLHSIGIIHRDLKPENVLLNEQMHIQITDFGTAKILEETEVSENTTGSQGQSQRRNSFVGTAQYVSPEVLTSKSAYYSSDLWALGCIIYQLLSGQLPFWGGHEYQIFQKIMKCEYEFPAGFHAVGRDLVEKLLVCDPTKRLGCKEMGGYGPLKQHRFFEGVDWNNLPETKAPELLPYLPVLAVEENWSTDKKPGLHIDHYIGKPVDEIGFLRISKEERKKLLDKQERENDYRSFVEGNLILKQGFIDKRKGLFARRRMFLLTEGPHLYYVDPQAMVLKGQIPWSKELRPEPKNFKIFFVHTPNRTYYLEDPEGNSLKWCKKIQEVYNYYYSDNKS